MKTKLFILCIISIFTTLNAQVGIGTDTPDPSAILDLTATDKGLTFPVYALASVLDSSVIPGGPDDGLIIYNTSENGTNLFRGLYYWNANASPARWEVVLLSSNYGTILGLTKAISGISPGTVTIDTWNGDSNNDDPTNTGGTWTDFPNFAGTILVNRSPNEFFFKVTGMVQANNANSDDTAYSYDIGIFASINGGTETLLSSRRFYSEGTDRCDSSTFLVDGVISNLPVGSTTFTMKVRNATKYEGPSSFTSLSYGGPAPSCTTLNHFTMRIFGTGILNQPL